MSETKLLWNYILRLHYQSVPTFYMAWSHVELCRDLLISISSFVLSLFHCFCPFIVVIFKYYCVLFTCSWFLFLCFVLFMFMIFFLDCFFMLYLIKWILHLHPPPVRIITKNRELTMGETKATVVDAQSSWWHKLCEIFKEK